MAQQRVDEVLGPVGPDQEVIPRYDIIDSEGRTVATDAKLVLKNPVVIPGMSVDKVLIDECLAASGHAGGTKKILTLEQEGFALFDGAVVRIHLFDHMAGAVTLNVNNTGAKRIKTSAGEDPDDITKNTWVDLVYSASRDQYILLGGGGGSAALSQSINLLEEVVNMKYCRILTSQQISTDVNNDWLSAGVISAFCETENYFYYARVRLLATNLEIRRVHKTSQAVEHFAAPLLASNSQWFTNMGGDASNRAYAQAKRLYLTPLRNGDGILWYALMRGTYYSSGQRYYSNKMSLGIFFSSGKNYRLLENDNNNQNNDYNFYILFNHVPLFNGYYSNGRAFLAVPNAFVPNTWNLSGFYPTDILCIVEDTGAQAWRYSDGPSYGNSQYGRAVWIIDDTKAVFFPITRFYNSDYSPYSSAFCCTCTFSASSGPSSYKVIGSNITYPLGSVQATSLQTGMVGWCITDEEITLMCVAGNTPGLSSNDGTHINMFTFKLEQNSASYDSVKMYPTFSSYFRFLPGYPNKKAVCYMFTNLAYEYVGLLIDITSNEAQQFICAVTPNVKAKSSTSYVWGNEEGSGAVSQIVQKNICYIVDYGQFRQYDMDNIIAEDAYNMLWTCEEDGIYKLIGVGGGAAGGSSFGGGAGYLQIATVSLVTGDQLHIKIGRGQKYSGTTVDNLIADYLSASATIVYLNEDTDPILYAAPGRGNTGGATGAATASGGGAGGYDLVQYGGQGMNYRTPTVTTSTGTTINPVPLSKDRNGGVSANTGAVTSGDGYGAGGGMNQDGKDGCLVIIR